MIKIITLGTGTFFVDKKVSSSAFLVQINDINILIDCGPGTLVKLSEAGFLPSDIDHVLITHLHPDHTSDLFPLFMNYRLNDVFTPELVEGFPTFWGPKTLDSYMLKYSHLTELRGYEGWGKIPINTYTEEFKIDSITIKTYPAVHEAFGNPTEGYSIRFEVEEKVVTFSGDTADCPGVREACKDADLFICDCSFPKSFKRDKIHMNTHEIGEIAEESDVKEILLDHFYPHFKDIDMVAEVKEKYKGKVRKASDLEVVEV